MGRCHEGLGLHCMGQMLLGQEEVAGKYKAQTSGSCVDHRCLSPQLLLGLRWTKDVGEGF